MKTALRTALAIIALAAVLLVSTGCAAGEVIADGGTFGEFFNAASVDLFGVPEQNCTEITVSLPRHAGYDVLADKTAYDSLRTAAQREAYTSIEESLFFVSDEWSDEFDGYAMRHAFIPELNSAEIFIVKEAVLADHPEAFWITGDYGIGVNMHDGSYITLYSGYSYNDILTNMLALERSIISVFKEIPSNRSEYERELIIHDILVRDISYATESVAYANSYIDAATTYGALVEDRAICTGYSQAFKLLCNRVGLSCRTVKGISKGEGHMWNLVRLDGYWYHTDVTWDDPVVHGDSSGTISYDYLNLSDEWITADHEIAADFSELERLIAENPAYNETAFYNFPLPVCTAVRYNYYQQNAVRITELNDDSAQRIAEIIYAARQDGISDLIFSFPRTMDQQIVLDWLIPVLLDGCEYANNPFLNIGMPLIESCERTVRSDDHETPWNHIHCIRLVYEPIENTLTIY